MSQVPIKETSSEVASRIGYWPGHVVADSLGVTPADETTEVTTKRVMIRRTSEDGEMKQRQHIVSLRPGSSFSAIISSMLPIDLLTAERKSSNVDEEYVYDEFGFRVERDEEDENKQQTNGTPIRPANESAAVSNDFVNIRLSPVPHKIKKVPSNPQANGTAAAGTGLSPFVEDSKHKLKWIAYLG